jgi:hypothetical protein
LTDTRVVVVGGFGNFGARICRRLAQESGLDIVCTGRQLRDRGPAGVRGARLDTDAEIPCMAAQLLTLKLIRGDSVPLGARPCVGLLSLSEFEPEFARWGITTQVEVAPA